MIRTDVPGDPASVRAAAGWLRVSLRGSLEAAGNDTVDARSAALGGWDGRAADAYRSTSARVLAATDDHADRVGRAATALEEYAARLASVQAFMADLRTRAINGGLAVHTSAISPPPAVPAAVVAPGSPEAAAHEAAVERVRLYDELAAAAEREWTAFREYTDAHLSAALADAREADDVDALRARFEEHLSGALSGIALGFAGLGLRDLSKSFRADAAEFRRRSRVAGDPRIKGLADTPSGRAHLDDLMGRSRWIGRAGRLMGPVGVGLDVYTGYREGQETGDWTRATLTTGAGIGTSVGIGVLVGLGVVSAGPVAVVVGTAVAASFVAWGVGEFYDHHGELAEWAGDRVDDVQELAGGAWQGAQDLASDAWEAVTPW